MKFENVLAEIGGFGKFQYLLFLLLIIPRFALPSHFLLSNFFAAVTDHHCDVGNLDDEEVFANLTHDQRLIVRIPRQEDGTLSSCKMFKEPQFHLLYNSSNAAEIPTVPCQHGWVYDTSTFSTTIQTEWDLVCDRKGMGKITVSVFFIGVMFGVATFGYLSDKFGRKKMLLVSYLVSVVSGLGSAFSNSYIMFIAMRFFIGFGLAGLSIISVVLCVEWVDIEHRTIIGVLVSLDWTFSTMILSGVAYLFNAWRWLTIAVTSPLLLALITWWWIPESARWLIANGKVEQAQMYLEKCARINNRASFMADIKPETLTNVVVAESSKASYSFLDLVKTPKMRKLAVLSGAIWYGVAVTYYGITLNIAGLGLNIYLTQFIYGAIEFPAKIAIYFSLGIIGRRLSLVGMLGLTGACIATNLLLPNDMWTFRTTIAVLGKGFSEASFTIIYLYTTELFPTVLRQNALGFSSFVARLGVTITPLIVMLEDVWRPLPQVIFGAMSLFAAMVAWVLPETLNVRLPETIEDVEQKRKRHLHACPDD